MNSSQTILLVDDSENDLLLLETALTQADFDYQFQNARNGAEAIAYLDGKGEYFDRAKYPIPIAVLLDLNMPQMNGFEVLTWARGRRELKNVPFVVLTASLRMQDVQRAYELGAQSYLVKPASLRELASMLRKMGDWLKINHFPPYNHWVNSHSQVKND